MLDPHEFEDIYRREVGRCTATLVRILGDVDEAEDAVADAFLVAAERWASAGIPPNPGGWITTTARNRAVDRLRRESSRGRRERAAMMLSEIAGDRPRRTSDVPAWGRSGESDDRGADSIDGWWSAIDAFDAVPDDQLRLIFLCCHPALGPEAQVALTLRLLGGLTTAEIARAFLVPESTMGQRLSRAKRKIRDSNVPYRIPDVDQFERRLVPVLATIYLIFTEGHSATAGTDLRRPALTSEAIRVGRILVELLPEQPEAVGLLALMLLTEARSAARLDDSGALVRLADQDRRLWDLVLIEEGHTLVRACIVRDQPGPYQIQAAIAAVHAAATAPELTDWAQIVTLYDHLLRFRPYPVVALNRAVAVMEADSAHAALASLDEIDLPGYHVFHATQAEAFRRIGRTDEARVALRRAIALASNAVEIEHLEHRLRAIG